MSRAAASTGGAAGRPAPHGSAGETGEPDGGETGEPDGGETGEPDGGETGWLSHGGDTGWPPHGGAAGAAGPEAGGTAEVGGATTAVGSSRPAKRDAMAVACRGGAAGEHHSRCPSSG